MSDDLVEPNILRLTSQIVSAHVSHNRVEAKVIPEIIQSVFDVLRRMHTQTEVPQDQVPAVAVKKSVFPDYIICLEDGKKLKMLRRHLKTAYNMTPEAYREKWKLPANYPMVAPRYAERRSELAKNIGLGQKKPKEDSGKADALPPAKVTKKKAAAKDAT